MTLSHARRAGLRLVAHLGLLLSAVLLLVGCETSVRSTVTVIDVDRAQLDVEVRFRGDVAEVVRENTDLQRDLAALFERRGLDVTRSLSANEVSYRADVDHAQLIDVADLTGIAALRLDAAEDGHAIASVDLRRPGRLAQAIEEGVSGEPDADALVAAMLGTTDLIVTVRFPRGIADVEASDGLIVVGEDTVAEVSQPLSEFRSGTVSVTGVPGRDASWWRPWGPVAVATVALLAVVAVRRLRRRQAHHG